MLDGLPDAVVAADGKQRIVLVNTAAERLLGWPAMELLGRPLTTIIPERLHAAHREAFDRYMATHEPKIIGRTIGLPLVRRDGTEVEVELTLSASRGADGDDLFIASLRVERGRVELERQLTVMRYL